LFETEESKYFLYSWNIFGIWLAGVFVTQMVLFTCGYWLIYMVVVIASMIIGSK